VDHPLRATASLPLSVWRTAAVVAILVAAVELILLVVAGVALLTGGGSSAAPAHTGAAAKKTQTPARTPAKARSHASAAPKLARGKVRVVVLNGNGRPGAAAAAATRVRQHGYRIGKVGNAARMSYGRSIVMYRPGFEGEGRRLARDLGIRLVGPLDGMQASQLGGAQAVLILGA
jgi:hypothetical protein